MNKRWYIWIIIVIFFVAVGSGVICSRNGKTVKPKVAPVVEAIYALGIVTPYKEYSLRVGMSTKIERLFVWEGDAVVAGSPLVQLDGGIILRAPFTGTIAKLDRKENEIVTAQESIMTIVDPHRMYVRLSLDQESIINVKKKQKAQVSFENLRNTEITGYVSRIYPSDGEFVVTIDVDAFPQGVLPYMTCDVAILVREKEKALLLPQNAVINNMVYVIRNGGKTRVKVTTRKFKDGWLEVLEGDVKPEDSIIVR